MGQSPTRIVFYTGWVVNLTRSLNTTRLHNIHAMLEQRRNVGLRCRKIIQTFCIYWNNHHHLWSLYVYFK